MNQHISEQKLIQYVNQALTDVEKAELDTHLSTCVACRALLEGFAAEYQMILESLHTNLHRISPARRANFAAIAPRLSTPGRFYLSPTIRQALTNGGLLMILLISIFVFVNDLRRIDDFGSSSTTQLPVVNGAFEVGNSGLPPGWILVGSRPQDYEVQQDHSVYFDGEAGALLASKGDKAREFGTLMQTLVPDESVLGRRARLSAYIKTEDVVDWAGLWMRVDGPNQQGFQFDNMQDRAIRGTTDWTRYAVVLDVPLESEFINLGLLLNGPGRAWIDGVTLEIVGNDVPSTHCQGCLEDATR